MASNPNELANEIISGETKTNFERQPGSNWIKGSIAHNGKEYEISAKVYDKGSEYGINNGRISKLWVRPKEGGKPIINYDRGWDIKPTKEYKKLLYNILDQFNGKGDE